jgi:hypothetical protein
MHYDDFPNPETEQQARPWIVLKTTYDIESWIDQANRRMQYVLSQAPARVDGQGICFSLEHGGEIFTHTTPDGDIMLDVTEDAAWVRPVIAAVAGSEAAPGAIWHLPGECLTELLFGLNQLITTTRIVLQHDFRIKKRY